MAGQQRRRDCCFSLVHLGRERGLDRYHERHSSWLPVTLNNLTITSISIWFKCRCAILLCIENIMKYFGQNLTLTNIASNFWSIISQFGKKVIIMKINTYMYIHHVHGNGVWRLEGEYNNWYKWQFRMPSITYYITLSGYSPGRVSADRHEVWAVGERSARPIQAQTHNIWAHVIIHLHTDQ